MYNWYISYIRALQLTPPVDPYIQCNPDYSTTVLIRLWRVIFADLRCIASHSFIRLAFTCSSPSFSTMVLPDKYSLSPLFPSFPPWRGPFFSLLARQLFPSCPATDTIAPLSLLPKSKEEDIWKCLQTKSKSLPIEILPIINHSQLIRAEINVIKWSQSRQFQPIHLMLFHSFRQQQQQ